MLASEDNNRTILEYEYSQKFSDNFLDIFKKILPNPETRHDLLHHYAALKSLPFLSSRANSKLTTTLKFSDRSMPITLASPIILAAGGNKYGKNLPAFASLGFGGVTVGSASLKAHEGNPFRPRIGMLPSDKGMNNSMGLNNPGIDVVSHLVDFNLGRAHKNNLALGISVVETPGIQQKSDMIEDMLSTFRKAYRAADYIEVNVSCPNTGKERIDAHKEFLKELLNEIMTFRSSLAPRKAVFIKLSPDMSQKLLDENLQIISDSDVTGVVLFNTFPWERAKFLKPLTPESKVTMVTGSGARGGVSGRLLYQNTLPAIKFIKKQLPKLSILASGGIDHGEKVLDLMEAGAHAVQCYTVLAYRFNAIHKMNKETLLAMEKRGYSSLDQVAEAGNK